MDKPSTGSLGPEGPNVVEHEKTREVVCYTHCDILRLDLSDTEGDARVFKECIIPFRAHFIQEVKSWTPLESPEEDMYDMAPDTEHYVVCSENSSGDVHIESMMRIVPIAEAGQSVERAPSLDMWGIDSRGRLRPELQQRARAALEERLGDRTVSAEPVHDLNKLIVDERQRHPDLAHSRHAEAESYYEQMARALGGAFKPEPITLLFTVEAPYAKFLQDLGHRVEPIFIGRISETDKTDAALCLIRRLTPEDICQAPGRAAPRRKELAIRFAQHLLESYTTLQANA